MDLNFVINNGGRFTVKKDSDDIVVEINLPKDFSSLEFNDSGVEIRFNKFVDVVSALIKADRQLHEFVKYDKKIDWGSPFDLPPAGSP